MPKQIDWEGEGMATVNNDTLGTFRTR